MVERYRFWCQDSDAEITREPNGGWVRHSDYAALEREIAELRAILARAVPTINAVERLRDIRSAGYPREDEENRLCETIKTFCGDVGNALEHDHG